MITELPICPICREDTLHVRDNMPNGEELHYNVECWSCGTQFHHKDFYGYNAVLAHFDQCEPDMCDDYIDEDGAFECSCCGLKHAYADDEKPYLYCPRCGSKVNR